MFMFCLVFVFFLLVLFLKAVIIFVIVCFISVSNRHEPDFASRIEADWINDLQLGQSSVEYSYGRLRPFLTMQIWQTI